MEVDPLPLLPPPDTLSQSLPTSTQISHSSSPPQPPVQPPSCPHPLPGCDISPSSADPHVETPDSRPSVREPSSQLSGSMVYVPQLSKSALDVLDGHSHTPPRYEEMSTGDLGDLLYYRFGYIGSSTSFMDYSYTNRFNSWGLVCSSVGGHNMQCRESERPPIMYFLTLLLESRAPLKDILMDLWDLSPDSLEPLAEVQSFIHIVNTNLKISTPYFLQQRGLHATRDCSWILAVSALSALQCLRRSLGPHTVDIARDLVSRGIPFQTFAKFKRPDIDVQSPPFTIPSLPIRLSDYTLDLGDYVAYEMMRDLFLCAPRCRAALQMGGIVWRLAQQCLPDSAVLCGPSQDALDGHCEVISCDEEKFCDDTLPDVALDLICGVYKIPTHGQFADKSWWPKYNVWLSSGYNYGQWTHECEKWFVKRIEDIHSGTASTLTSKQWHDQLWLTNTASKLTRAMEKAAAAYISGSDL